MKLDADLLLETRFMEREPLMSQLDIVEGKSREWLDHACFWSVGLFFASHAEQDVRLPFGRHHDVLFNLIPRGVRCVKKSVLAPRNSAKSRAMEWYIVHCVVYKAWYEALYEFADHNILITCLNRETSGGERLANIKDIIETYFPQYVGKDTWAAWRIITSNGTRIRAGSAGTKFRGINFRGFRVTLMLSDDLEDIETLLNPETAAKASRWFYSDYQELSDDLYGNFINIDTLKAGNALALELHDSPSWTSHLFRAITKPHDLVHPTHEDLWRRMREIWVDRTIDKEERVRLCREFYDQNEAAMTEGVEELWPEKWKYRDIRLREFDTGRANVLREYQNYPEALSLAIFAMDEAVRFEVKENGLHRSDGRIVEWNDVIGLVSYLDFAGFTEQEIKANCFASVATVVFEKPKAGGYGNDPLRGEVYAYLVSDRLLRGNGEAQFTALCEEFHNWKSRLHPVCRYIKFGIGVEHPVDTLGAIRESFSQHYRTVADRLKITEELQFVSRTKEKDVRIRALEAPIRNGWLAFDRYISEEMWRQLSEYPASLFNDGPDSVEGALSMAITQGAEDPLTVKARRDVQKHARRNVGDMITERVWR